MNSRSDPFEKASSRYYRFGGFELDTFEETLSRDGRKLTINNRTFQVLSLLIERRGEIVTKDEFFEKVWGGNFVEDNNLTVAITSLRKTLGDDAKHARFIENLPRKGYRFVAEVESVDQTAQLKSVKKGDDPTPTKPGGIRTSVFAIGILSVLLISTLAIGIVKGKMIWPVNSSPVDRIDSIAVLPFENRTSDSEYLADGLTDSIIGNLSKYPGLRVIGRNSAYTFRGKTADLGNTGRELNVRCQLQNWKARKVIRPFVLFLFPLRILCFEFQL